MAQVSSGCLSLPWGRCQQRPPGHYLHQVEVRKVVKQVEQRKRLKFPNVTKEFAVELRNRFAALAEESGIQPDINTSWETIKRTYVDTATKVLDYNNKNNKEWITPGIWPKLRKGNN